MTGKTTLISSPSEHIQRANAFVRAGNYAGAEVELVAANAITPDFCPVLEQLSTVQFHQGKVDAALATLERAIRKGTSFEDRSFLLAARIFSSKKMYDEGIKKLLEWGSQREVTPNFHAAVGILKLGAYELGPAETELREALKVDPGNEAALTAMSQLYGKLDKYPRLQPFLDKGVAAKPSSISILMLSGNSLLRQERFAEAKDRFEAVIKLDPTNANAFVNRGSTLHALGDVAGAMRDFQKGTDLAPTKIEGPINLALALEREKKFAEARDVLVAARGRIPQSLDVLNALAMAHHLNGELDAAMGVIKDSLQRDADQPSMKTLLDRIVSEKATTGPKSPATKP